MKKLQDRYELAFKTYSYQRSSDQDATRPVRRAVVIIGGGPIGIATALDLGLQGIPVVVLDDHEGIGMGSRAICFSKRSMEIADRYGCGEPILDKGVVWNVGKVFHKDRKVFEFDLLPDEGHKFPAFINLQQPLFERFVIDRVREPKMLARQLNYVVRTASMQLRQKTIHVVLDIMTPDGPYKLEADWLIAADGAYSPLRKMLGLEFEGRVFSRIVF